MKKASTWAGIIGGLLAASTIYQIAQILTNPTTLPWVNVAKVTMNSLQLIFAIFLGIIYLKKRQREDAGHPVTQFIPGSVEDITELKRQRKWIFAFFLIFSMTGSSASWVLNNYGAGLTLINIFVIFDLILNVALFYLVVQILRNKDHEISNVFFFTILIYGSGGAAIALLRQHWFSAVLNLIITGYFAYAIKAPLNRKNHRIAHLIFLPVIIILILSGGFFDNGKIPELTKKDVLLEQQFIDESNIINAAYQLYLQKEAPDIHDIQNVKDAVATRDNKIQEILTNFDALVSEYNKQLPNIAQQEALERIKYFQKIFAVHRAQGSKLEELMGYSTNVDFRRLSEKEATDINNLAKEVLSYLSQITDLQNQLQNANLSE